MSFVLDALKISENKRSKFARAVYAHPPRAFPARRRRRWLGALALAAATALVLLVWRMMFPQPPGPQSREAAERSAGAPAVSAETRKTTPVELQEPENAGTVQQLPRPLQDDASNDTEDAPPGATRALYSTTAETSAMVGAETDEEMLSAAPPDWPALTLQMLFYDPQEIRSFVQINGRSYRTGDHLEAGPQVQEIATHSVILFHDGQRVRLSMDQ